MRAVLDKFVVDSVRLDAGLGAIARWRLRRAGVASHVRLAEREAERRVEKRHAVRLNWGKALDGADRFLSECLIVDRSGRGVRLRLARAITVPARFQLSDDADSLLYPARLVWRRGREVGCRLARAPIPNKPQVIRRMKGPYYAL